MGGLSVGIVRWRTKDPGFIILLLLIKSTLTIPKKEFLLRNPIFLGKPEEAKPLWKAKRKWQDDIKMDLK
jgi:hypothetical protein